MQRHEVFEFMWLLMLMATSKAIKALKEPPQGLLTRAVPYMRGGKAIFLVA